MCTIGVIAGLSVPREERVVSVEERALGYWQLMTIARRWSSPPLVPSPPPPTTPTQTSTLLPPLPTIATAAAGVKCHLRLATASHWSSTLSNAAANATAAIEPRLHRPPPPPRTAWHYSLPCWEYWENHSKNIILCIHQVSNPVSCSRWPPSRKHTTG